MKYVYVSNNFKFGNKREGDVKLLKFFEEKFNYRIINPSPLKKKKKIISSTSIRKLLEKGQISTANKYLVEIGPFRELYKLEENWVKLSGSQLAT